MMTDDEFIQALYLKVGQSPIIDRCHAILERQQEELECLRTHNELFRSVMFKDKCPVCEASLIPKNKLPT